VKPQEFNKKPDFGPLYKIWLVTGLAGITLYINPRFEDPFNSPKFIILIILTAFILGSCLVNINKRNSWELYQTFKLPFTLSVWFLLSLTLSTIGSDNLFTSFFGEYQRKNGFLSYFCLTVIFIYGVLFSRQSYLGGFYKIVLFTGFIFTSYGILQDNGIDFVKWNNPYNSIITTLGNPNFSSAVGSIIAMLVVIIAMSKQFNLIYRSLGLVVFIMCLYIIAQSQSRQGIVSLAAGLIFFATVYFWYRNKKIGLAIGFIGSLIGAFSVLGMLQLGPMERFLYKDSVSVRGYYWRAGISMLRENLFLGVGLDRYGAFFKEFREPSYALKYGYEITSSNAHNVYIQMFATGGLLLGLSYISLALYIFKRGLTLVKSNTSNRMANLGLMSAWIVFQAQSLISIDNLGISVWGWMIGSLIVGISLKEHLTNKEKSNSNQILSLKMPVITILLLIPAVTVSIFLYRSENYAWLARSYYNPSEPAINEFLKKYTNLVINNPISDPQLKFKVGGYLMVSGDSQNGIKVFEKLVESDPRNQDAIRVISVVNYQLGLYDKAINNRKSIAKLDPWNANNLLELGKLYFAVKDYEELNNIRDQIFGMAPDSDEARGIQEVVDSSK